MSMVEFSASGMMIACKPHPSDGPDDGRALVAPRLTLLPDNIGQRSHPLRAVFNGLRDPVRCWAAWTAARCAAIQIAAPAVSWPRGRQPMNSAIAAVALAASTVHGLLWGAGSL